MNSSQQHYDEHLASYYAWSVGGVDAAIARAEQELLVGGLELDAAPKVADLGAGFGAHAIALGRRGARVTAVDESERLLAELAALAGGLPVEIVHQDIVEWISDSNDIFDAVLCMGDTLTHLPSVEHAQRLVQSSVARLRPGGRLLITLRDYTLSPPGSELQLVVQSDLERIATCIVEYREQGVFVRDLLHQRVDEQWRVATSRYMKLKLAPRDIEGWLTRAGASVTRSRTPSGMTALLATRAPNSDALA